MVLTSSSPAMIAAGTGLVTASVTTATTATSPASEAPMLLTGSGEVLTARRTPAFAVWLRSAVTPPTAARAIVPRSPVAPPTRAPITAPTTGRTTVEIASQAESR